MPYTPIAQREKAPGVVPAKKSSYTPVSERSALSQPVAPTATSTPEAPPVLPKSEISAAPTSPLKKLVRLLPKPVQSFLETGKDLLLGNQKDKEYLRRLESFDTSQGFMGQLHSELQSEGFLSFLGRSEVDQVSHLKEKLEEKGVPPDRAGDIAFYDFFSRGNPTNPKVKDAKAKLAELSTTDAERSAIRMARIGQFLGSATDVANFIPAGFISKAALPGLTKILRVANTEKDVIDALKLAKVPDDVATEVAPKFVSMTDDKEIASEIDNLAKLVENRGAAPVASVADDIPENLRPLADEAKNFKTADEFTATRTPIEQYTRDGKEGKFWSPVDAADSGYGDTLNRAFIDESKLFKGMSSRGFLAERGLLDDALEAKLEKASMGSDPNLEFKITQDIAEDILKKEGYPGALWSSEDDLNPTQYQVWDRSVINTKEELDDVYTRATSGPGKITSSGTDGADLASLAEMATTAGPDTVKLPPVSNVAKGILNRMELDDLKRAVLEAKTQRDIGRDVVPDMPGAAFRRYESKKYPGELPDIETSKSEDIYKKIKGKGEFARRGDQIAADLGFPDADEAREAFAKYKSAQAQLKEAEDSVRSRVKDYRDRKAVFDEVVRYVKQEGKARREKIKIVQDFFKLGNDDMKDILKGERDVRLMTDGEFDDFMKRIEGKATEAYLRMEDLAELRATIFEKEFVKLDNLRKAMKLPTIENMSPAQMRAFNEFLQDFKVGDEFLGVRQLETVKNTDLEGIHTIREAQERLLADINKNRKRLGQEPVTLSDFDQIKVAMKDKFLYDTALARQNPLYDLMVRETHKAMLNADAQVLDIKDKVTDLFSKARQSRKRGFLDRAIPTDKRIFQWLEAPEAQKILLAQDMTAEELEAAMYVRAWYAEARDYLVQQGTLKRSISDYVTHIRRGFLEGWLEEGRNYTPDVSGAKKPGAISRTGRGLLAAMKEAFKAYQDEEAFFNIMNEKTGDILPLEKFFQFSLSRSGELIPTKNVADAFVKYARTFEKKRMLDSIIPKLDIYAHSLTPKKLTPRGLEYDDSLKRFFKQWMNTKKGRPVDLGFLKPGDKLDWALRTGVALTRILDLGLSLPVGIASNLGAQTAIYRGLGEKAYATGLSRLATKQGRKIVREYRNLVGESVAEKMMSADANIGDNLLGGAFGLFAFADRKARQAFLLASLTKGEFEAGKVSADRLTDIQMDLGRHLPLENFQSIIGKTAAGKVVTQYKTWAVPLLASTIDDLNKLQRALRTGDKDFIRSREFGELMRTAILSSAIGFGVYGTLMDDKPMSEKTFLEKVATKASQDALSAISALDPRIWLSVPRLAQFVANLADAAVKVVLLETNENGELTGLNKFQNTVTPGVVRQLIPPEKKKKGAGGLPTPPSLPPLPKLPKTPLPELPKLPKLPGLNR